MLSFPIKTERKNIPAPVKLFAKRALLLLVGWIFVYHVALKPYRIPDRLLSNTTAMATANFLNLCYAPASFIEKDGWASVTINNKSVIRIGDPCNALDLIALYIGFILCLPTNAKRMLLFIAGGIMCIFILNTFRCTALAWLAINKQTWVDFAHKYAFTAIVYCTIFYGWILYVKNDKPTNAAE
jgi:exosortase family protein XrtF